MPSRASCDDSRPSATTEATCKAMQMRAMALTLDLFKDTFPKATMPSRAASTSEANRLVPSERKFASVCV